MENTLILRTATFAGNVRSLIKKIPWNSKYSDDLDQVLRASGSVAANYIEAQEALSTNDFLYRIRVCRKEARECTLWLALLKKTVSENYHQELDTLLKEVNEFVRMFTAIAKKIENKIR